MEKPEVLLRCEEKSDSKPTTGGNKRRRVFLLVVAVIVYVAFSSRPIFGLGRSLSSGLKAWTTSAGVCMSMQSSEEKWTKCGDNIECASIEVPYDYFNSSAGVATLAVAKFLATDNENRLGTIFTNPGGPGGSGVVLIFTEGAFINHMLDGKYDIISWDPRGINGSNPKVNCFTSQTAQDLFGLTFSSSSFRNLSDPADRAAFSANLVQADAVDALTAELCQEVSGDVLNHVGTATVVRDMERLSTILEGPDEPVNYWGFSYGTAIGSYFVNMFPDRVGHVIIDGNINPELWANIPASDRMKYDLHSTEQVLQNFYDSCAEAGPERCALAAKGSTGKELSQAVDALLEKLYYEPLPVVHSDRPSILTVNMVQNDIFNALYRPMYLWTGLASDLLAALNGDGAPLVNSVQSAVELNTTVSPSTDYSINVVTCTDAPHYDVVDRKAMLDHMLSEYALGFEISPHFASASMTTCHNWKAKATERFTGPFNHTLANPILIIGNIADPITPLIHAQATHRLLGDSSRLITQNSSGHCSVAMPSLCTINAIRAYLHNDTLPEEGLLCQTDTVLFPPNNTESLFVSSSEPLEAEHIKLLESARHLGEGLSMHQHYGKPRRMY